MPKKVLTPVFSTLYLSADTGLGKNREIYHAELFDAVVHLSQNRICSRLRSSQWEKPRHINESTAVPLYVRIKQILVKIQSPALENEEGLSSIQKAAVALIEALKLVDRAPNDFIGSLKEVIRRGHELSNQGTSKSLEHRLQNLGVRQEVAQSQVVMQIDKLSKYLQICHDLIRLSRQPKTRFLCKNIRLETCPAYPGARPAGSPSQTRRVVHGEVQMILFYEQYPISHPPRAIGSSKSACFLCDLFVNKHGVFGISHAHMHLYTKWKIPDCPWMNKQQIRRLRTIVRAMDLEIVSLLKRARYHSQPAMESRAHILQLVQTSSIATSSIGPKASDTLLAANPRLYTQPKSRDKLHDNGDVRILCTLYYLQDLPISVDITPSTVSCTLLAGNVDYCFDIEDVAHGRLEIGYATDDEPRPEVLRVDIRQLSLESSTTVRCKNGFNTLSFNLHDAKQHELRITLTWITGEGGRGI